MRTLALLAGAGLLGYSILPEDDASDAFKAVQKYRAWHCVTPEAMDMVASTAVLCRGPMSWDTDPHNPHFRTLYKVYVNEAGKRAMENPKLPFPVGSIIVKEKYQPKTRKENDWWKHQSLPKGAKPVLLTTMIKREKGFAPEQGDWQYMVLKGDASEETTVGLEHCAPCHQEVKNRDYVFRSYVGPGGLHLKPLKE
ncbi:MAG: hypothetical protein EOP85_23210 [Verrucomicrobiaceae bacterium]|nr:MAG: hypothetical protein EOP85_23210 [Verrucomicrobiaceae bacterium]